MVLSLVESRKAELEELRSAGSDLEAQCAQFDLPPPDFGPVLAAVEADLDAYLGKWALYKEYAAALAVLTAEPWAVIRAKLYVFDDFVGEWRERLRAAAQASEERSAVVTHLAAQVQTFLAVAPLLKFCRGDSYTAEHWGELYRFLSIPRTVARSDLTFGHIVRAAPALETHGDAIKHLYQRAQGEIQIREALAELTLWSGEAAFTLLERTERGRTVPIITEWKEVTTQVCD